MLVDRIIKLEFRTHDTCSTRFLNGELKHDPCHTALLESSTVWQPASAALHLDSAHGVTNGGLPNPTYLPGCDGPPEASLRLAPSASSAIPHRVCSQQGVSQTAAEHAKDLAPHRHRPAVVCFSSGRIDRCSCQHLRRSARLPRGPHGTSDAAW